MLSVMAKIPGPCHRVRGCRGSFPEDTTNDARRSTIQGAVNDMARVDAATILDELRCEFLDDHEDERHQESKLPVGIEVVDWVAVRIGAEAGKRWNGGGKPGIY